MLFIEVLAILGFAALTAVTVWGVFKDPVSDWIFRVQLLCGLVGATAVAYIKPLLYGYQVSTLPAFLEGPFAVEWVEMLLATYAYGWLVWITAVVIQQNIQDWLDRKAMAKH